MQKQNLTRIHKDSQAVYFFNMDTKKIMSYSDRQGVFVEEKGLGQFQTPWEAERALKRPSLR